MLILLGFDRFATGTVTDDFGVSILVVDRIKARLHRLAKSLGRIGCLSRGMQSGNSSEVGAKPKNALFANRRETKACASRCLDLLSLPKRTLRGRSVLSRRSSINSKRPREIRIAPTSKTSGYQDRSIYSPSTKEMLTNNLSEGAIFAWNGLWSVEMRKHLKLLLNSELSRFKRVLVDRLKLHHLDFPRERLRQRGQIATAKPIETEIGLLASSGMYRSNSSNDTYHSTNKHHPKGVYFRLERTRIDSPGGFC